MFQGDLFLEDTFVEILCKLLGPPRKFGDPLGPRGPAFETVAAGDACAKLDTTAADEAGSGGDDKSFRHRHQSFGRSMTMTAASGSAIPREGGSMQMTRSGTSTRSHQTTQMQGGCTVGTTERRNAFGRTLGNQCRRPPI
eukprot:s454_g3.t1